MPIRKKTQVTLTLMDGAEPWIRVDHAKGWFKLPADCSVLEVLELAAAGCNYRAHRRGDSVRYVRVPASLLVELQWRSSHP